MIITGGEREGKAITTSPDRVARDGGWLPFGGGRWGSRRAGYVRTARTRTA